MRIKNLASIFFLRWIDRKYFLRSEKIKVTVKNEHVIKYDYFESLHSRGLEALNAEPRALFHQEILTMTLTKGSNKPVLSGGFL